MLTALLAGAGAILSAALVVPTPAAAAVDGTLPEGLVWVARAPGAATSVLYRAGPDSAVTAQRLPHPMNAIGCAGDGTVYGLGDGFPGGPRPVRVDPDGTTTALGRVRGLPRYGLATAYAATLRGDRLLVRTDAHLRELALEPPGQERSVRLPDLPYLGDWDVDADGGLWSVAGARRHGAELIRLDAADRAVHRFRIPHLPGGRAYGGIALDPSGDALYALYHHDDRASVLYRVPLGAPGAARAVARLDRAVSTDAAMCPVQRFAPQAIPDEPEPPPVPSPAPAPVPSPAPLPSPSAAPSPEQPVPSSPRAPAGSPLPRMAHPPVVPRSDPPPPSDAPAPTRRPRRTPQAVAAEAQTRSLVGTRVLPVLSAVMMIAAVTTRLARSSRRSRAGRR